MLLRRSKVCKVTLFKSNRIINISPSINIGAMVCFVLFCISGLPIYSQTISEVKINGNTDFPNSEYLAWSGIKEGDQIFEGLSDSISSRIIRALLENGYLQNRVSSDLVFYTPDSQSVLVDIKMFEGKQTFIRSVYYNNNDSTISPDIHSGLLNLKGKAFIQSDIEGLIIKLINEMEIIGFPFCKIKIENVYNDYDSISQDSFADIVFTISRGLPATIDDIKIIGNEDTKEYVITREIKVSIGEKYSQEKIENIPRLLNRLRFFDPVGSPNYYLNSKNEGVLEITVKERQTNNFDGIIGYIPPDKSGDGYVTGLVNISMRNLLGTGRAAAVRWQKIDRYSQELELKYLEPYVINLPFNISTGFYQKKQDTTYIYRKLDLSLEFLATNEVTFSVIGGTESVIPTISDYPKFTVYNSSLLTTGVNLKIDTRDDPISSTSGILFINSYYYSRKTINGPAEYITNDMDTKVNLQRIFLDFNAYFQLFSRQVLMFGLHGKELQGDLMELSDLFRLGGANTLRGYRENQFLGSRIFWSNLEYRFLLSRRTYLFSFFDMGYYLRKADEKLKIEENSATKIGYGLGINLETGLGVLSVSFALAKGDSFSEGKIHFGIVNEF